MIVVLMILSVGLLGVIIYFAISPKSSQLLKRVALIALGVIGLSLLVCGYFIIRGPAEEEPGIPLLLYQDAPIQPQRSTNILDIVILGVLLTIIAVVIAKAMKDERKKTGTVKKFEKSPVFQESDDLGESVGKVQTDEDKDEEDSFDIGLDL